MKNTFSAGSHLATNDFIALVIWMFAFAALVFVRPERLQIAFTVSFILVSGSWIGLLIWYDCRYISEHATDRTIGLYTTQEGSAACSINLVLPLTPDRPSRTV